MSLFIRLDLVVVITLTVFHAEPAVIAPLGDTLDGAILPANHGSNGACIGAVGKIAPTAVFPLPLKPVELEVNVIKHQDNGREESDIMDKQGHIEYTGWYYLLKEPLYHTSHDDGEKTNRY